MLFLHVIGYIGFCFTIRNASAPLILLLYYRQLFLSISLVRNTPAKLQSFALNFTHIYDDGTMCDPLSSPDWYKTDYSDLAVQEQARIWGQVLDILIKSQEIIKSRK